MAGNSIGQSTSKAWELTVLCEWLGLNLRAEKGRELATWVLM